MQHHHPTATPRALPWDGGVFASERPAEHQSRKAFHLLPILKSNANGVSIQPLSILKPLKGSWVSMAVRTPSPTVARGAPPWVYRVPRHRPRRGREKVTLCSLFFTSKTATEKWNNSPPFRRNALYGFFVNLDVKMEKRDTFATISPHGFCKNIDGGKRVPQSSARYPMVLVALSLRIGRAIQWIATPKPLTARCKTNG